MKTKIIYIALVSMFSLSNVSAQESKNDTKGFISIGGGLSLPMGNIKKTVYENVSSGFAKSPGGLFTLDGVYFFKKKFGAGLSLSSLSYGVDSKPIAAGAVDAYAVDEATVKTKNWKFINILPCFYYTSGGEKFAFDARILLGYQHITTPDINIQLEDNADATITQKAATGSSFVYGIGIAGRYKIVKNFGIRFGVDFISSKPNIDIANEGINNTFESFRVVNNYNENIRMINGALGINYSF